ncbi:MAG: hypothetical protein A3F91_02005 [Flavobacteria bacterium RIFCSPLOWO2_12_FULL_35_11]|nr:MAG: hypothetical protein A3F91_02005 [Flavobacteria bacterium RIFCSPLOWO2_12_FULL_35_11]
MKVFIIEFIDEFEAFKTFLHKNNFNIDDFIIVALEPRLQAYLKKQGIRYRNALPYFNNESHRKIIIETEKIMNYIHEHFTFIDGNGLRNCYKTEFSHYIRLFLNHLFKILEILENIYKENKTCEIYAYVKRNFTSSHMIANNERYTGILAETYAKNRNLNFINFNENDIPYELPKATRRRLVKIENLVTILSIYLQRKKKVIFIPGLGYGFGKLTTLLSLRDREITFLGIDYTEKLSKLICFNILSFLKAILWRNSRRYYVLNPAFIHKTVDKVEHTKLMECITSIGNSSDKSLYEYNGVSYHDLLKKKIETGLKGYMSVMLAQAHNLKYLFEKFNKKMVMSSYALGIMSVAGELAKKMKMISLFISHGVTPPPVDLYHEIELLNLCKGFMLSDYTHVALSTPVQEDNLHFFKKKYSWVENEELRTGPLIFADLTGMKKSSYKTKLGLSPDDIVATHATVTKGRQGERYHFVETLDEYFSSLSDIINVVDKSKNLKLIIRIHPGFHLSNVEINALLPTSDRFIIQREGQFSEVLAATDFLISYSSTTIDEALINRIPVLLYDKWNRYNHYKTDAFESEESLAFCPVCYVNDTNNLENAIEYMIKKSMNMKVNVDLDRYRYTENYNEQFYRFIEGAIK